jgi:hypothetical protein
LIKTDGQSPISTEEVVVTGQRDSQPQPLTPLGPQIGGYGFSGTSPNFSGSGGLGDGNKMEEVVVTGDRPPTDIKPIPPKPQSLSLLDLFFTPAYAGTPGSDTSNQPKSKPYICRKLASDGYDVKKAWADMNGDRKTKSDGRTNWNTPTYRQGENWATAASGYFPLPFAWRAQVYAWQYQKLLPFGNTTPFSQDALDAGLNGLDHYGDTTSQLKAWCDAH